MKYNFYIQKYSRKYWDKNKSQYVDESKGELIDIEAQFKCKYVKFEGLSETGKVKNVYTETYAEQKNSVHTYQTMCCMRTQTCR